MPYDCSLTSIPNDTYCSYYGISMIIEDMRGLGSGWSRKKEMRGSGPWTVRLSRRGEMGFLGRTLLLQIGPSSEGEEGRDRGGGLNEARK